MLDRMGKKAREQEIFLRGDTPAERRFLVDFCITPDCPIARPNRSLIGLTRWFGSDFTTWNICSSLSANSDRK
jgi:hypothetical protein